MKLWNMEQGIQKAQCMRDEEVLVQSLEHPYLFSILLDRYRDAFLRKAQRVMHNKEDAEDVVQETFSRIYLYARTFEQRLEENEGGTRFKSWAYKILMHTAFTHYQRKKRDRRGRAEIDPSWYEEMPDRSRIHDEELELADYVISILARIPEDLGRILRLQFLEEKSQETIAAEEGLSISAVKTRVYRAKQAFREASTRIE